MSSKETHALDLPVIGSEQIALLEKLSNAAGISGDEGEVRKIVLDEIKGLADEITIDPLGSILAVCKGAGEAPLRVMLAAHMDEVGFMLVDEDGPGLYAFSVVGGVDARQLPGKMVLAGKQRLPGVIGAKPIHLQEKDESGRTIPVTSLRIDIGPGGKGKLKPGDRAVFATRFQQVGPSLIGKALDDRLGVATWIDLMKRRPRHIELLAAFTVQEEVGLRGARVAGYALQPDLAFALDSTPSYDLPVWDGEENTRYNTRIGAGPAIYTVDGATINDPRLVRFLVETAETRGIPYQFRQPGGGGTDAGAIHKVRAGVPSVSISVPGRYAHTAAQITRTADWQHTFQLIFAALHGMDRSILAAER